MNPRSPLLKQRLQKGDVCYGVWCMMPSPFVVEVFCHHPFDWVGIDLQHGLWAHDQMVGALQVVDRFGILSIVRVTARTPGRSGGSWMREQPVSLFPWSTARWTRRR